MGRGAIVTVSPHKLTKVSSNPTLATGVRKANIFIDRRSGSTKLI